MFLFLPLGTSRPRWRVPFATYGLIALNLLVFGLQWGSPDAMQWGFVPGKPSLTTWFTSMFTHAGVVHLLGNLLFLWLFGTLAEDVLGPLLFLGIYLLGNFGATALDIWVYASFAPASLALPRVGASGAIAGIMGLAAVCFIRTRVKVAYLVGVFLYWRAGVAEVAAPVFIGLWAVWELVQGLVMTSFEAAYGVVGGVGHWSHLGGFGMGLVVALALGLPRRIARGDLLAGRRESPTSLMGRSEADELERIVQQAPQDADAWAALARTCEVRGYIDRAKEAHRQAMLLFLSRHRHAEAVKAYQSLRTYQPTVEVPDQVQFDIACALQQTGHDQEAFDVFRALAARAAGPRSETALIRAAEIAHARLGQREKAAECYRAVLRDYPHGPWRSLCLERLRALSAGDVP